MRERVRTLALYAPAAAVLAWCWLRLERPHVGAGTALWLIALAVVPFLLQRRRVQAAALGLASVLALHVAFGTWITHPLTDRSPACFGAYRQPPLDACAAIR